MPANLIVTGAVQNLYGVGQQVSYGIQGFSCAFGASGQVDNEGFASHGGGSTGKNRGWRVFQPLAAHLFGDARYNAVGDRLRRFRSVIAWANSGSSRGQEHINPARIGQLAQLVANACGVVRDK